MNTKLFNVCMQITVFIKKPLKVRAMQKIKTGMALGTQY